MGVLPTGYPANTGQGCSREALTLSGLAVEVDQLRRGLEAVAARVRHHEEVLRRLTRHSRESAQP